jgi:hypothetical protein
MINLSNVFKSLLNINKKINLNDLPSQGLFYPNNFELSIKKASIDDITEYEYQFSEDIGTILFKLKKIVKNNTILSEGFGFDDIKSMDIIFIFIEIVKFTNNKPFYLYDSLKNKIEFSEKNFNYFDKKLINDIYSPKEKNIQIEGFKYTLPTIGIETCLSNFIVSKSYTPESKKYETYSYDFIYFVGQKNSMSNEEMENLIQIFNYDMEESDREKVRKIVHDLSFLAGYSLIKDSQIIGLSSNIDLQKVWK